MRTAAVLPIKTFASAKQRLAGMLAADDRTALAAAMAFDVLETLRSVAAIDELIVVSGEPAMSAAAAQAGAHLVADEQEAGHSDAAARGIRVATALGATRVLLVPGDCPALAGRELDALLSVRDDGVVVVPDRLATGTNALLLQPPDVIAPGFGPGSRVRHVERARAVGASVSIVEVAGLELDIDTPQDLNALAALLSADPARAPRTARILEALADMAAA